MMKCLERMVQVYGLELFRLVLAGNLSEHNNDAADEAPGSNRIASYGHQRCLERLLQGDSRLLPIQRTGV